MARFGYGTRARRHAPAPAAFPPQPPALPIGFALNGSTNPALRGMLAGVRAGTRRGRIVFKGDSTTVGDGGGNAPNRVSGGRANRAPAALAAQLSATGTPALDGSCFNGSVDGAGTVDANIAAFDPRVSLGSWGYASFSKAGPIAHEFAGSGWFGAGTGTPFTFTPDVAVDTFEIVFYNIGTGIVTLRIDGAIPAGGPATVALVSDGHLQRVTVTAATRGQHRLAITSDSPDVAMRSVTAYDSAAKAIDILVQAGCAANSGNQSTSNGVNRNNDSLRFDAPDLTIINCGLNDMNQGMAAGNYQANLQTMITTARVSGDVLLVFPHPAGGTFNNGVAAFRAAAAALAVSNGVAFLSLYDYFGGAFTPAVAGRLFDIVHPKAEMYAEIGKVYRQCVTAMAT